MWTDPWFARRHSAATCIHVKASTRFGVHVVAVCQRIGLLGKCTVSLFQAFVHSLRHGLRISSFASEHPDLKKLGVLGSCNDQTGEVAYGSACGSRIPMAWEGAQVDLHLTGCFTEAALAASPACSFAAQNQPGRPIGIQRPSPPARSTLSVPGPCASVECASAAHDFTRRARAYGHRELA